MNQAASIDQLQNLPLPTAVSYLPQTWGWLALLLLLLAAGLYYAGRALYRWQRDRYRRVALAELARLEARLQRPSADPQALRQLPELLKRTALSMPGQPTVASLGGAQWQQFLQRSSAVTLPADFSQQLAQLAYAPAQQLHALTAEQIELLLSLSRQWLEQLHAAV